jgi:thiamine pyrophosphate-dependent acetolactate synthase large subunit-like protein
VTGGRTGSELLVESLAANDVRDFFHIVGGPITQTIIGAINAGIRGIDVRDERAGTYAAVAYSRVSGRPGVMMACSGPGSINTVTGVAHAYADGAPVVILGGSAATFHRGTGAFQETDQVGVMRPITKWSHQVVDADGIDEALARALHIATTGAPGPVYLDLPADALFGTVQSDQPPRRAPGRMRSAADPPLISDAVEQLRAARQPVVVAGSGVLWSQAWDELRQLVEIAGVPFYTTPITAGLIPEDHRLSFPGARSTAFREADCVLVVGTRDNYVLNSLAPPVFSPTSVLIEVNVNPDDLSANRAADVAILGDARLVLNQVVSEWQRHGPGQDLTPWIARLHEVNDGARERSRGQYEAVSTDSPIHPHRLAIEVRRAAPRDAIMVLDGRETLTFGRRAVPSYFPAGMLNPGTYGTMGVGVPYAIGARVADPGRPVVALVGDGAFGYHAMEIDTAVRHGLGFVCVVANNAGWTANRDRPGHALDYSSYERVADVFGGLGLRVDAAEALGPALDEAVDYVKRQNKPAIVNVMTASVRAGGRTFSRHGRNADSDYDAV